MKEDKFIGVDGCKAGWFFVALGKRDSAEFGVFENIEKLYKRYSDAQSILIDIPIGLPTTGNADRSCDKEARRVLSPKRHTSIFSPPCREALKADSFKGACQINREILGKGVTQQTYHIFKKIKEVDDFLNHCSGDQRIARETHPEICFWALAGCKPMSHPKKSPKGLDERLELLIQHYPSSSSIFKAALDRFARKEVARDDILDALALAITSLQLEGREATLPKRPARDVLGLPMEMVYALLDETMNL
jgi:predicted RNase H-like nuclease